MRTYIIQAVRVPSRILRRAAILAVASVLLVTLIIAGDASAAIGPQWKIATNANTTVAPGGILSYVVSLKNEGDASFDGSPDKLEVRLPQGLTGNSVRALFGTRDGEWECGSVEGASVITCTSEAVLPADGPVQDQPMFLFTVNVDPSAAGTLTASFTVSGGGAPAVTTVDPTRISATPPPFGIDAFDSQFQDANGETFTQAGGHPYQVATSIDFNSLENSNPLNGRLWPVEPTKDVIVDLPPGVTGDPQVASTCTVAQMANGAGTKVEPLCPSSSQVGVVDFTFNNPIFGLGIGGQNFDLPLYRMPAPDDVAARFGFSLIGIITTLDVRVRSGSDYGVSIDTRGITEQAAVSSVRVTFWGTPADPVHDIRRGCPDAETPNGGGPTCPAGVAERSMLRMPTSCSKSGEGLTTTMETDSWLHPGVFAQASTTSHLLPGYPAPVESWGAQVGTTGCEGTPFTPRLTVRPTTRAPASPAGLTAALSVPQEELVSPGTIAQADLKRIAVRLPQGMTVNPSSASGLQACTPAEIGLLGSNFPAPAPIHFTPSSAKCPDASKIGTVEINTPALEGPLDGSVYLASQGANPFNSLLAVYLVAEGHGVVVKSPGRIEADPLNGRLTAVFDDLPQQPVSSVKLSLSSGSRAPLITSSQCGTSVIEANLEGWDRKAVNRPTVGGVDCAPGLGSFAPSLTAGTVSNAAGAFSPFVMSFSRNDGEQQFKGLTFTMPAGASAVLKGVPECSDADANAGKCPEAARIGSVTVGSGAGPDPFFLKGSVYLTGPYSGGPFGEAVVVPAVAGPFNLGNVVVRGSIRVDPHTAQASVVSDPFPQFVNNTGIPTDVRRVDVTLDRPDFTFNPTNCSELHVTGTLTGAQGATANVSSRFQAANCATLPFHPSFKVSTQGTTSRVSGASLDVKVGSSSGQANIGKVHVSLPKQLPSRLSTLNQACTESVFDANPAACPAGSNVGNATAITPLLSSPLSGPAYLVSHGGAAYPDLEIVLQGEGVTLILDGKTDIKNGITSSSFDSVPDAPISTFELRLPEGPHSALAAPGGKLCSLTRTVTRKKRVTVRVKGRKRHVTRRVRKQVSASLIMPTTITGQNGAVKTQSTRIEVTGCVRHKTKASTRHKRQQRKKHR